MLRYAITDRRLNSVPGTDPFSSLEQQARRLAADHVDFLQVREKDLEAKELIGLTRRIITAARDEAAIASPGSQQSRLRILVNGRPDIALATGADGVHLPSAPEQFTVAQVRKVFGGRLAIVSVACHTLEKVRKASVGGADLILFSPIFGKSTPQGELEGTGLARLAAACDVAGETPVLALGGVSDQNAPACLQAGARGVAGIRLFH